MQIIFSEFYNKAKETASEPTHNRKKAFSHKSSVVNSIIINESMYISNTKSFQRGRIAILLDRVSRVVSKDMPFWQMSRSDCYKDFLKIYKELDSSFSLIRNIDENEKDVYKYATLLMIKRIYAYLRISEIHFSFIGFKF